MGVLKASKTFGVPRSSLENYVNHRTIQDAEVLCSTKLGRKCVLPYELESKLAEYCMVMEERFYGLRSNDIQRLAFQLAARNNMKHPFSEDKGAASNKWLKNFLRCHPSLSLRKPQAISAARAKVLNKSLQLVNFSPSKIFHVDETGLTVVQHKCSKVVGLKGMKQVTSLSSAERGALITLVTCVSAPDRYIPPMLEFPHKNMKVELLQDAPPDTIAVCHPSGWSQQELFTQWMIHFVEHVKSKPDEPVVLVCDGHYSYTRNIDVIEIGRKHGINIKHPFRVVTGYQVAELLGKAYLHAAIIGNAVKGFRKCGICPFNPGSHTSNPSIASISIVILSPTDISPPRLTKKPTTSTARATRSSKAAFITIAPYKRQLEQTSYPKEAKILRDLLQRTSQEMCRKLGLSNVFYFQQNNDSKHTVEIVRLWIVYNIPYMLNNPPQSPGLKHIEHLWEELGTRLPAYLEVFSAFKGEKRASDWDYSTTRTRCVITTKRKSLNWGACSRCAACTAVTTLPMYWRASPDEFALVMPTFKSPAAESTLFRHLRAQRLVCSRCARYPLYFFLPLPFYTPPFPLACSYVTRKLVLQDVGRSDDIPNTFWLPSFASSTLLVLAATVIPSWIIARVDSNQRESLTLGLINSNRKRCYGKLQPLERYWQIRENHGNPRDVCQLAGCWTELHKGDDLRHALMISARVPFVTTGSVCRKSPANTKVTPPIMAVEILRISQRSVNGHSIKLSPTQTFSGVLFTDESSFSNSGQVKTRNMHYRPSRTNDGFGRWTISVNGNSSQADEGRPRFKVGADDQLILVD
ncbi:hypothetical protein PR048_005418 [Dryococelus australis]|uniref:HTH CENPB-type domain-containing protein n=1 Tax=Dryococelus australis TaxID=614101 RepID=A0ABQ9I8P9_9NEOP|nr:hypothetical protein PR048_005418 [Dryococelus australis]